MEFDRVLREVNPLGYFQKFHFLAISLTQVFKGTSSFGTLYIIDIPDFACSNTDANTSSSSLNITESLSEVTGRQCFVSEEDGNQSIPCNEWHYSTRYYKSTIVTEWDLVCSDLYKRTLVQSTFLVGYLIGSVIFGWISDRYGRRTGWMTSMLVCGLATIGAGLMPNYWAFLVFRTTMAAGSIGSFITSWVLMMEMILSEKRGTVGTVLMLAPTVGGVIVTGIAYVLRDHVWIQVVSGVVVLAGLPFCWFSSESPRWLISQGRLKEAEAVVLRMSRMNGRDFKMPDGVENVDPLMSGKRHNHTAQSNDETTETSRRYTVLVLFRSWVRALATLNIMFYWVVVTIVFYGLFFGATELAGSPYLMVLISCLVEIPGYGMLTAINKIGRRAGLSGFMLAAGLALLAVAVIQDRLPWMSITFFMIGRMFSCSAFAVIYTYSAEFYPTVVRSVGLGAGSMCARIGGLVAPFITDFGATVWTPLPQVIFGGLAILSGIAISFMPETRSRKLPETIAEGDELARKMLVCCPKSRQQKGTKRNEEKKTVATTEETTLSTHSI